MNESSASLKLEHAATDGIRFAVADCVLGLALVAWTDTGVCGVLLGDDRQALHRELERRFPGGTLIDAGADFDGLAGDVIAFIESPGGGLDVPLDLRGTAFQRRVWEALLTIPAGRTASYAEIANRIGRPRAVRAVAQACAANPVAVLVPCHRVVASDGALTGYRWGIERKRALIEREAMTGSPSSERAMPLRLHR